MEQRKSSRRTFLKTTALTVAIAGITPRSLLASGLFRENARVAEEEKDLVFLFQGDSITEGGRWINSSDQNHIMGQDYAFIISSHLGVDFPKSGFSFYNRGISGNTVFDLQKRWKTDSLDIKPDILSVLIGINDTFAVITNPTQAETMEQFEAAYRDILTQSKQSNPRTLFVLGIPFVYPVGPRKVKWELWRDETAKRAAVVRKLAAEFNAIVVDYPAMFAKVMKTTPVDYWIWDGIHPTIFGHELMAREWVKQVGEKLRFLKRIYV